MILCETCGNKLKGRQTKFCSRICHNENGNTKFQNYQIQKQRGIDRKIQLMKDKGGKCQKCGYDKNLSALSFHHINPEEKLFGLDARHCSNNTIEKLIIEAAKCELLCLNCHAEHHNPTLDNQFFNF